MKEKIVMIENEPNPEKSALKQQSTKIIFPLTGADQELIAQLQEIVLELGGVGLAAPQIGVARNIAVIYIPKSAALLRDNVQEKPIHVIINATYQPIASKGMYSDFEGCYSVNSVMGKVPRYNAIKVKYQDATGKATIKTAEGFYARVLQHEIDHLHGLLITDRLTPECLQGPHETILKIRRAELPAEKRKLFDSLIKQKGLAKK
ncbi:MAG: peptide deformylase [Proteobacteria bacterium]|nr:peptide deformylase [Pseudomonadota bacterium]